MTSRNHFIILLFAFFACGIHVCGAQEDKPVTLQFLSFPKCADPQSVELLIGDGKTIEVKTPTNALSEEYLVKSLKTWAVGKTESRIDKDGGTVTGFTAYGQAPALASQKQLILLIRNGRNNSDGMRVIPIDNSIGNLGGGQFFFMNASKVDIAGKLGDANFAIKPGTYDIVKPVSGLKQHEGLNFAHTELHFRKENEAIPFFSSTWPVNQKARSMVFFYHDTNNNRLRFHSVRNFIQ